MAPHSLAVGDVVCYGYDEQKRMLTGMVVRSPIDTSIALIRLTDGQEFITSTLKCDLRPTPEDGWGEFRAGDLVRTTNGGNGRIEDTFVDHTDNGRWYVVVHPDYSRVAVHESFVLHNDGP